MELEITDMDVIQNGANTLFSCIGTWMIAVAHFNPQQLTTEAPAIAGAFGVVMIMAGLLFSLSMRGAE